MEAGDIAGVIVILLFFGVPGFTVWYIIYSTSPKNEIPRMRRRLRRQGYCPHKRVKLGGGMWDDIGTCDECGFQAHEEKFWRFGSEFYREDN